MTARLLLGASFVLLFSAACGDDTGGSGGSGSGSGSGTDDSSGSGNDCPEVSDNAGGEACENETCDPGEYCEGFSCTPGCENANTCPEGQYCDLSGADATNAGTCRNPPSECTDSSAPSSGSGAPADCEDRCVVKLVDCGFEEQVDDVNATCSGACEALNAETLECLEDASCASLTDGEECGVPFGD